MAREGCESRVNCHLALPKTVGAGGSVHCIAAPECPGGWDPSSLTRFGLLGRVPAMINCCGDDSGQGCGWLETGYR